MPTPAKAIALVALAAAGCRGAGELRSVIPAGAPNAERVVVVSFDGLAADRHARLRAAGAYTDPHGLAAFDTGLVVERALPSNPTLTSPSHIAIAAGAPPARTGIVANRFHLPGTPITETVSGFDHTIGVETLWESMRRQGRRVGSLAYPGCNGPDERRRADFAMHYVQRPAASAETVRFGPGGLAPAAARAGGDAPPAAATLVVPLSGYGAGQRAVFHVAAVDTSADGRAHYDSLRVDDNDDPTDGVLALVRPGQWFPLRVTVPHEDGGTAIVGAWCLLRRLEPDLSAVEVYRGEFNATEAYPRPFRETLDREAGFWPGPPDGGALERSIRGEGGLSPNEYLDQVRRFSEFFTACARTAVFGQEFDLLLTYQPIIDEVQHIALVTDPRQVMYSEGLAATGARLIDDTYRIADRAVGDLARALDLRREALVVVSDHGIEPVWETVHLNEALHRAGLVKVAREGGRMKVAVDTPIVAVGSGGCAHLYVNVIGREPTGVVSPQELPGIVRQAAAVLARLDVDGEDVVEAMFARDQLARIGLDHPNSGDLVVFLRPGFSASGAVGGTLSTPAAVPGQHGYLNHHVGVDGVWMARGAAVGRARLREARLTAVASFVSRLLGAEPPAASE